MTTTETTFDDYAYWTEFLNGRQHKKVANNTYVRREGDVLVIKYHDTDILFFRPNGDVEYQSGGWLTYTTKDRLNNFGAHAIRISQTKGRWFVYGNGQWDEPLTDYYDGLIVNGGSVVTETKHEVDPDKKIKRDIDRYVALYTDEKIKELLEGGGGGDCWFCMMRTQGEVRRNEYAVSAAVSPNGDGSPMGDAFGDNEHLLSHIEEGYTMIHLAYNAIQAAGYRNPAVILRYGDMTRRAIKRYLRQRLATNTAGAAGGPKPHAEHWNPSPDPGY